MNWAALLTSPGRGAVATIAIDAPADGGVTVQLPWRGATRTSLADIPLHAIALGQWGGDVAEEVVIGRVGESKWEIHCHGGVAASARILDDLRQAGFNLLTGFEWIALHDGLLVAEWSDALSRAETARTAQLLHEQSTGLLRRAVERLLSSADDCRTDVAELESIVRWSRFGRHLTEPWRVAVAGLPNAGKSSLANRLLGYTRSIVYEQPGTTRDVVTAMTSIAGWPIELADTAGLRATNDAIEAEGVRRAESEFERADLVLYVVDGSVGLVDADHALLAAHPHCVRVLQKYDLPAVRPIEGEEWLAVSTQTGEGIERLLDAIAKRLVPELPPTGWPIPVTDRQSRLLEQALAFARQGSAENCSVTLNELLQGALPRIADAHDTSGSVPP